jgi:hypothetical protein
MTKDEFLEIGYVLSASCGKEMPEQQARVYYELLRHLDPELLRLAVLRAVAESQYPVIPPVGVLLKIAQELASGPRMLAIEAWDALRRAIARYGYNRGDDALASLPPAVARVARALGWQSICDCVNTEVLRAQFTKAYDQMSERDEVVQRLPEPLRRQAKFLAEKWAPPQIGLIA